MKSIILIGFMGAGKTTVGTACSTHLNMPFLDTDLMIEEAAGMTISQIFAEKGEGEFRRIETSVLETLLRRTEAAVISVGGGLPLLEANRRMLKQIGTVIYLEVSPETVLCRLKGDTTRPLLQGGDAEEKVNSLIAARDPVYRMAADEILNVNDCSIEDIVTELIERTGIGS